MLSRRKKNKNIFLLSCNTGFDLRLTINYHETQIGLDQVFGFQFYQT